MEKGCENCRHKSKTEHEMPCASCIRNATDKWEPELDVVEVVRCKDCKHTGLIVSEFPESEVWCNRVGYWKDNNWYCASGERRSNGEESKV